MRAHPYTVAEPWEYETDAGRPLSAPNGYIGISAALRVSGIYNDRLRGLERFTGAERRELATWMIARWSAWAGRGL